MQKMTATGYHHRQAKGIAGSDRIGVAHAAARLNHSSDALTSGQPHGVIEGEEAIASKHRAPGPIPGRCQGQPG